MSYTHNSDLEYYKKYPTDTNCGSFALQLKEWYTPEDKFENEIGELYSWVEDMAESGYSEEEVSNFYLDAIKDQVLNDFQGEIEICDGRVPSTKNKELIALATFCRWDEDIDWIDCDFHFKVFRDGRWQQKRGSGEVTDCNLEDWGDYISDVIFFYHKI